MSSQDSPSRTQPAADRRPSIGAYLARQRELRSISLDELEALTRIPRRSLERLEAGAFDRGSDGFARGFVRTVALGLGLDPDDALARMLAEPVEQTAAATRSLRLGAAGALAAAAVLLATAGFLWISRGSGPRAATAGSPAAESDLVYRRDPVRGLLDATLRSARRPAPAAAREDGSEF